MKRNITSHLIICALLALACACSGRNTTTATPGEVPTIAVGIMTVPEVRLTVRDASGAITDTLTFRAADIDSCLTVAVPAGGSTEISDVTIGVGFHWEQQENQRFEGSVRLLRDGDRLAVINDIDVESYLESVISSEMSADSPAELLRAHAIISRSWLLAQIGRKGHRSVTRTEHDGEVTAWYDRDDHRLFDVCADDHCQRYQGVTRRSNPAVAEAVRATRGRVLTSGGELCDARFSKCCGGVTEEFENCWEDDHKPYLESRRDREESFPVPDLTGEAVATIWIEERPDAFCADPEPEVLAAVLNNYDRSTTDFYRWTLSVRADSLGAIFARRTGRDIGYIKALTPLTRGRSGRITRLKVTGHLDSIIIGKELEIRRSLSPSHLYSSAFTVTTEGSGPDAVITLHGAGWGHGVGLCQIGAAVMAARGYDYTSILSHYFPNSQIETLYQ